MTAIEAFRDRRFLNVPKTPYTPTSYEDTQDVFFRERMSSLESALGKIKAWPIRLSQLKGIHTVHERLLVSQEHLAFCLNEIRNRLIIIPIQVRVGRIDKQPFDLYYDPDDLRAVGAYVLAKKILTGDGNFRVVSPEETIRYAKIAMGQYEFTALLRDPLPLPRGQAGDHA